MDDVIREPCPRCGEPAALAGRACPHCAGSLLVNLEGGSISDQRAGYRAARDLSRLGPQFPTLLRAQELLASPESVLATDITREAARKALDILAANSGKGRIVPRDELASAELVPEFEHSFRSPNLRERLIFIVPALAAAAILFFFLLRPREAAPHLTAKVTDTRPADQAQPTPSLRDLAAQALDSTATVRCPKSFGSGFFVAPDLLVTNEHVLCTSGAAVEVVLRDGRRLPGRAEASDDWLDVALVRVPGAAVRPLPLGDATLVEPGETVLMIGSPLGMEFTVTRAIVSHSQRNVLGIAYLQFDGNVNPGNSGGPLLDARGRAIGIASMMVAHSQGLGLALPVNYLYDLPGARLPLPVPPPDFGHWRSMLERVKKQDDLEVADARVSFTRPGLGGAAIGPTGAVFAIVVVRGRPAGAVPFTFDLVQDGRTVCNPTAIVETWDFYKRQTAQTTQDSRYLRWLQKNGLGNDILVGTAPLHMEGCPDPASLLGSELVLPGADSGVGRAVIGMFREVR
jgi:serine protease Do